MKNPLVSICIPVKDMARTICQTVESAIAQTYDKIEVLVVDNCSEDETLDLVSAFRDPRIRVVRNETDVGVYGNHNRCVELARGEFLKFLHGDDLLKADCVERMLEPFRGIGGEQIGLVACGAVELDQAGVEFRRTPVPHRMIRIPGNDFYEAVPRLGNFVGTPTMTLLRKATVLEVGGFDPLIRHSADFDCWLALALSSDFAFVPHHLVNLRNDPPSADPSRRYNAEQIIHYVTVLYKRYARTRGSTPLWRSMVGRWMCREAVLYTLAYGREALRGRPGSFRRLVAEFRRYGLLPQLFTQLVVAGSSVVGRRLLGRHLTPYDAVEAYFATLK